MRVWGGRRGSSELSDALLRDREKARKATLGYEAAARATPSPGGSSRNARKDDAALKAFGTRRLVSPETRSRGRRLSIHQAAGREHRDRRRRDVAAVVRRAVADGSLEPERSQRPGRACSPGETSLSPPLFQSWASRNTVRTSCLVFERASCACGSVADTVDVSAASWY